MRIEPNSYYKEVRGGSDVIFYIQTDDNNIYDIIHYKRKTTQVMRFTPRVFHKTIKDYNWLYFDRIKGNNYKSNVKFEKISEEELENDLLLEMI